ncbi:MAG: trigger factor [Leptospirales bacterium]|jgi:trigger factor
MDFKVKKLTEVTAEVTLKSTSEEVEAAFQRAYKKAQGKIKLPGFRAGKVPLAMVEKHLGDSVAEDAARELIAQAFEDVVEELDPAPISIPRFEIESFERGKGATFKGAYDSMPKVKLGKYKKIKVTEDVGKITDANIQAELVRVQKERSTLKTRPEGDGAENDDFITASIDVKDAGGKNLFHNENFRFQLGAGQSLPGMDEQVVGMKYDESKSFELEMEESFPDPNFAGKKISVELKIKDCQFAELPELNDEFAKDMGEFETLAEYKDSVRKNLEEQAKTALKQEAMNEILGQIVEGSKIHVPDSVVENEVQQRFEQIKQRMGNKDLDMDGLARISGQGRDKLETDLKESALKGIHDRLVLREITETESIEVSDEDVTDEIQKTYGQFLPPEQMKDILGNENIAGDVRGRLLYVKSLEWIYENGDVRKGKEVTLDALKEQGKLN